MAIDVLIGWVLYFFKEIKVIRKYIIITNQD